jgi:hypothetical protein
MIFRTLNIEKRLDVIYNFGIKNLIVSGCSFTFNNSLHSSVTWPYYLRDLGGFETVYDTSLPGAGNYHIAGSLQLALELDTFDPEESLVIVMWSGNDRDDYLCPDSNYNTEFPYPCEFRYSKNVITGITGGANPDSRGNTKQGLRELANTKTPESRAYENYLLTVGLKNYLENNSYRYLFLDYIDRTLPSRTWDFPIEQHLPKQLAEKYKSSKADIVSPNTFALKNNMCHLDDFHPSPNGHLEWTKQILIPHLKTTIG